MAKGPAEIAHGWMFIGFGINVLLCGIMITQVYLYAATYKKDPKWIKAVVYLIFLADLLNTGFVWGYLYRTLIKFYGQIEVLNQADWIFATDPALTGIIAAAVQLFFAWRIKILTKSWILCGIIAAMAVAGGVAGIWTAFEVGRTPTFTEFRNFKQTVIVWLAAEAVGDVLITSILVLYLRKHKTGFAGSDMVIDRIIRITVQTGLITMIVATLDLVFFLTDPTGTHLLFNFPLCKLYTNSLMSSLNSRKGWNFSVQSEQRTTIGDTETGQLASTAQVNLQSHASYRSPVMKSITSRPEVFVHVESHELVDINRSSPGKQGVVIIEKEPHSSNTSFEDEKRWKSPPYYPS
ncbi:hypothetical protein FA13DRAFT_528919 [Coprinellus micaceus]|uniref:DUF6534 domain-containing protein n=1 Tax=Coprinellus micaceus TaxID=71717 RepID=A0A4Y7TAW3_COPMI|nr:hypothetical protein FA13DRAFT_528919 [Coprinellus micaceus]